MNYDNMYETCRFCRKYENGECFSGAFELEGMDRLVDYVYICEQGYLSESIREVIEGNWINKVTKEIEGELAANRVGEKRRKNITSAIGEYIENSIIPYLVETLDENIWALMSRHDLEGEQIGVAIKDDTEFCCSEFE